MKKQTATQKFIEQDKKAMKAKKARSSKLFNVPARGIKGALDY